MTDLRPVIILFFFLLTSACGLIEPDQRALEATKEAWNANKGLEKVKPNKADTLTCVQFMEQFAERNRIELQFIHKYTITDDYYGFLFYGRVASDTRLILVASQRNNRLHGYYEYNPESPNADTLVTYDLFMERL